VVNNNGNASAGLWRRSNGKIIKGVLTDLKIDTSNLKPNPTTKVDRP
jgi:flagellar hook protein FlgE